ncbi:MAG: hypothetical protein QCI82_03140 [Candidatus Thermoplasmatota archaeon]|nr:hypothetical protein [Candidatus Thermoplasmatota archaeon]
MTVSLLLCMGSMPFLSIAREDEQDMKRSDGKYYLNGKYFIPQSWDRSRMYLHVFLQNRDRVPTKDVVGSGNYQAGMVANSYQSIMDGNEHSSGDQRRTLFELFTDTDCFYCPGADAAAHRIAEGPLFPDNITLIEWHYNTAGEADPFETGSSRARADFYDIRGTPTAVFDGSLIAVGGDSSWTNTEIDRAYTSLIELVNGYEPLVSFTTRGWFVENGTAYDGHFNVSVQQIDALPRGNWSFVVSIVEDMYDPAKTGEYHRFIQRYTKSTVLTSLHDGSPSVHFDDITTFGPETDAPVRNIVNITWSAYDEQDGSDLSIDIRYQRAFGESGYIAEGISNTGVYAWDTMSPRLPDGYYNLIVVAKDNDQKSTAAFSRNFRLDNLDLPELAIKKPKDGDSINGRYTVKWDSSDDEDERKDLRVRVSISEDLGGSWEVISYNFQTQSEWEVDDGSFEFNTATYSDKATYMIRIEVKDTDGMTITRMVGPFEIYNNDRPTAVIHSPTKAVIQTEMVMFEYQVEDQEDPYTDLHLLMIVSRKGSGAGIEVFNGTPSSNRASFSLGTDTLQGDGEYDLTLIVTDSRGLSRTVTSSFIVYDPDHPVFHDVKLPTGSVSDSFDLVWNASDPDIGETLTFSVHIKGADEGTWTRIASSLTAMEYKVDVSDLPDGEYMIRLVARDSSPLNLETEIDLGPILIDNPQPPEVEFVFPPEGFRGTIDNRTLDGYVLTISYNASDPDGGAIFFTLFYRVENTKVWLPLHNDVSRTSKTFRWDLKDFNDGKYYLKVVARDGTNLTGESTIGPFDLIKPKDTPKPPEDPNKDDKKGEQENDLDLGSALMMGLIILVVLVLISLVAIGIISLAKRKKKIEVVPKEEDIDLSVPEFDRGAPPDN